MLIERAALQFHIDDGMRERLQTDVFKAIQRADQSGISHATPPAHKHVSHMS